MGFFRKTGRDIVRVSDGILQLVSFQKSGWCGGDFCVNYVSMLLFVPAEYVVLEPGGRLSGVGVGGPGRWWQSATHEQADDSMSQVVDAFKAEAVPFFESTRSVAGLLKHLLSIARHDHHYEFWRGACFARLGFINEATRSLRRAVELYIEDGRPSCADYAEQTTRLLRACEARGAAATPGRLGAVFSIEAWPREALGLTG
jgi:hypothetical protein